MDESTHSGTAREVGTDPAGWPAPASRRPGRRGRRLRRALVGLGALVVAAGVVADNIHLNYYVLSPGDAQPVGPFVHVPASRAHHLTGRLLLTDVYLTGVTALGYLRDLFNGDDALVPAATLLGPVTPASELLDQGYLEMFQSQSAAKAAALTWLGYDVSNTDAGAVVFAVASGSPAARHLKVGEIIHAVDGTPVDTSCALAQALAGHGPGDVVDLTVERSTVTSKATLSSAPSMQVRTRLVRWPSSVARPTATPQCPGVSGAGRGYLGIEGETFSRVRTPFPVRIDTSTIGGPSAGLAMTLGIIDILGGGRLTGGHTVAVTGTIAPTGAVGKVGGVAQKAVAARAAGATAFLVPTGQVRTARSTVGTSLRVMAVRTLTQAVDDLAALGGTVPARVSS